MDIARRLQIEAECASLNNAFAYYLDQQMWEELSQLFWPNGVFVRLGVRLEGPEKILQTMRQRRRDQFTRHTTLCRHFTHVDETQCKAVGYHGTYYAFTTAQPPLPFDGNHVLFIDMFDTFTRTSAGWRFLERDARALMIPEDLRPYLPAEAFGAQGRGA
jgi:hypothetical protein